MRRGFKSACERTAAAHRETLKRRLDEPLDPEELASHLDVLVWRPNDVPELSEKTLKQLLERDKESWSAVTLKVGATCLTIVNSEHSLNRQRSSITHELAHIILKHEPDRIDVSTKGYLLLSTFEKEKEDEANWLAGALLVPREGLRRIFRSTKDPQRLAHHLGVSRKLLEWRLRMTGVAVQARRAKSYYRRAT